MPINQTLGTGLTALTNPDPNTLSVKTPYLLTETYGAAPYSILQAWANQGVFCLLPLNVESGEGLKRIYLRFKPSGGAAVTYTVTCWFFNAIGGTWSKPKSSPTISYTGEQIDHIENPPSDAIFLQLSDISTGTVDIYFEASNATKG